jgi:hypothetical protein
MSLYALLKMIYKFGLMMVFEGIEKLDRNYSHVLNRTDPITQNKSVDQIYFFHD